ncbi:hypothetical protein AAFF_G00381250 [Aldrovandia affinis]|uniref:C-CAP/cofactor C-like domain-containing protein n=1 Tax=Aldrovandia affinis TaxID=143900 RepID=A0AAD7T949_9TELE|nr:hypothetical protein AAFF_G00381250 [Aldrovandia affinis]
MKRCSAKRQKKNSVSEEKIDYFSNTFNTEKSVIAELLSISEESGPGKNNAGSDGNVGVDAVVCGEQCGFSNADSQVLSKGADEIQQRDMLLSHLTNCKVRLLGSPSTLHIKHVRDSEIFCGPVSSSVFVDQCSGCTLVFACQQLRPHNTTDTQVYLHVTSRAIIEDCTGIHFAPFNWSYHGIDADFKVSGLDRDRNNWNQVDDFNWLAAGTPSPNWTIIPESARKCIWD